MDSNDVDKILEDGVILRARQQDAIEVLKNIGRMKDKSIAYVDRPSHFYTVFELNMLEIENLAKKYADAQTPVGIYNHAVDCIAIFGLKDDPALKNIRKLPK